MKFKDIKFKKMDVHFGEDAVQGLVRLDNGFDLSVVKHRFSYGGDEGLYEIGVFLNDELVTPDGWHDQVKGNLNEDAVESTIFALGSHDASKAKTSASNRETHNNDDIKTL